MQQRRVGLERREFSAGLFALRESSAMRSVNARMREASGSVSLSDPVAFFCECRRASCLSAIWMSVMEYDRFESDRAGWLLIEDHEPSAPWPTREPGDPGAVSAHAPAVRGWKPHSGGGDEAA
jgi:hypothetical protein